jgi:hypothetical protein
VFIIFKHFSSKVTEIMVFSSFLRSLHDKCLDNNSLLANNLFKCHDVDSYTIFHTEPKYSSGSGQGPVTGTFEHGVVHWVP